MGVKRSDEAGRAARRAWRAASGAGAGKARACSVDVGAATASAYDSSVCRFKLWSYEPT